MVWAASGSCCGMPEMSELDGLRALITGGASGIGAAMASAFHAAGAAVVVLDVAAAPPAGLPSGAGYVSADITDDAAVRAAVAAAADRLGGLDVLVNNAGIEARAEGNTVPGAAELTADMMRSLFETNVFGVVRVTHAFLPLLRRSAAPVVVNVSSGLGSLTLATDPATPAYAYPGVEYPASKSALNMITVQYAKAFPGMRINAADPGYTRTDLNGNTGTQTAGEGARIIVAMAQLGPDGPTGGCFSASGPVPW